MHQSLSTRRTVERGQSVVEFAMFLPLLILLLAGAIDLGNAFQTWINLTNAAREGARYQSKFNDSSVACSRVQNELANNSITIPCGQVSVSYPSESDIDPRLDCTRGAYTTGCPLRVSVRYGLSTLVGDVLKFNPITITASVDMVIYGDDTR